MTDYRLVMGRDYREFAEDVRDALSNGWKCQGGVAVRDADGSAVYYQALVKEEECSSLS